KCDLRLRGGRTGRQKAEAALTCEAKPLVPERGLADSRIALEQQRLPAGRQSLQKRLERQQFLPPADDLACHRTPPIAPRRHRSSAPLRRCSPCAQLPPPGGPRDNRSRDIRKRS